MKNRKTNKFIFIDFPGMLCIAVAVICIAVVFTLNFRPLYYMEMKTENLSLVSGFSEQVIKDNYRELIKWNAFTSKGPLSLPSIPVSSDAQQHFKEVKRIFVAIQISGIIAILLSIVFILMRRKVGWRMLVGGGIIAVALPVITGTLYLTSGWDRFFIQFHDLLFNNDLWLFDEELDPIINILPESFFMKCLFLIIGTIVFLSIALLITGFLLRRKIKAFSDIDSSDSTSSDIVSHDMDSHDIVSSDMGSPDTASNDIVSPDIVSPDIVSPKY